MIEPDKVTDVLLADGWHKVDNSIPPGFECVAHGYVGVMSPDKGGFLMAEPNHTETLLSGPLSSILAVRYKATRTRANTTPTPDALQM